MSDQISNEAYNIWLKILDAAIGAEGLAQKAVKNSPAFFQSRNGVILSELIAHIHNVRLMWLKSAGTQMAMPAKLDSAEYAGLVHYGRLVRRIRAL